MPNIPEQGNDLIYVGIPRERFYITDFVDNRDRILAHLQNTDRGCGYYQTEGHRVDRNRDRIVLEFMDHPKQPEWLLMIDSDMEHPVECGSALARWRQPVVGALYFHRGNHDPLAMREYGFEEDEWGRQRRVWEPLRDEVYDWIEGHALPMRDGAILIQNAGDSALVEVDAVGTGCMLIHRSVLAAMEPPWFEYRDASQSEDLEFCHRAQELGFQSHVDLSVICGHYKSVAMGQAQFRMRHEGRGLSISSYSQLQAMDWLEQFVEEPELKTYAKELLPNYTPGVMAEHWQKIKPQNPQETQRFYEQAATGVRYLCDLLHWNASPAFKRLQGQLTNRNWRRKRVLEVGAGIGTLAIQLAVQDNEVEAVEPNQVLRGFACRRWQWTHERLVSRAGSIKWLESVEDARPFYDLVVATDVFEHIHPQQINSFMAGLGMKTKKGGQLFAHNNFGQQEIYPMHYDHSDQWESILELSEFFPMSDLWALKIT